VTFSWAEAEAVHVTAEPALASSVQMTHPDSYSMGHIPALGRKVVGRAPMSLKGQSATKRFVPSMSAFGRFTDPRVTAGFFSV
jgi:hypothetical protein